MSVASLRTSTGITERHGNVVPAHVLHAKRKERQERAKRVANTIAAGNVADTLETSA